MSNEKKQIGIRLTQETLNKITKFCNENQNMSMSMAIELLVNSALNNLNDYSIVNNITDKKRG